MKKIFKSGFFITTLILMGLFSVPSRSADSRSPAELSPEYQEALQAKCQEEYIRDCISRGLDPEFFCPRRAEEVCKNVRPSEPQEDPSSPGNCYAVVRERCQDDGHHWTICEDTAKKMCDENPEITQGQAWEDQYQATVGEDRIDLNIDQGHSVEIDDVDTGPQGHHAETNDDSSGGEPSPNQNTGDLPNIGHTPNIDSDSPSPVDTTVSIDEPVGSEETMAILSGGGCSLANPATTSGPLNALIGIFFGLIPFIRMGWRKK